MRARSLGLSMPDRTIVPALTEIHGECGCGVIGGHPRTSKEGLGSRCLCACVCNRVELFERGRVAATAASGRSLRLGATDAGLATARTRRISSRVRLQLSAIRFALAA